jgi:hypothetical protein
MRQQRSEGEDGVSIIAPEPPVIGAIETVDTAKLAIVPVAVFIIVEIMVVAETIWVILLKGVDPQNPGAAPIAMLLSMALLANLGLVCSIAAASAANSVRQSRHWEAGALTGRFAEISVGAESLESATGRHRRP